MIPRENKRRYADIIVLRARFRVNRIDGGAFHRRASAFRCRKGATLYMRHGSSYLGREGGWSFCGACVERGTEARLRLSDAIRVVGRTTCSTLHTLFEPRSRAPPFWSIGIWAMCVRLALLSISFCHLKGTGAPYCSDARLYALPPPSVLVKHCTR